MRTPYILSLAWQSYPFVWLCLALAVAWKAKVLGQDYMGQMGRILLVLGLISNWVVVLVNNGMPVVGMPAEGPASQLWLTASAGHRFLYLADNAGLYYYSIGDVFLRCGGFLLIASLLFRKLKNRRAVCDNC